MAKILQGLRRWWPAALTAAVLAVGSGLLSNTLHLEENITSALPDTDPLINDYRFMVERFRSMDSLFIDVGTDSDEPGAAGKVVAVADRLNAELLASGHFSAIHYRNTQQQLLALFETLSDRKARLLSAGDLPDLAGRLESAEIGRRLAAARQALLDPSGPFVRDQVRRDPLGLADLVLDKLAALEREGGGAQLAGGQIWSRDGKHLLIIADPVFPAMDTVHGAELAGALEQASRTAVESAGDGRVEISCVGGHLAALDNSGTVKRDVILTLSVGGFAVILIMILFFRRISSIGLSMLPAWFGFAVAAGVFALFHPELSAIAVGCSVVLMGIAVDAGLHLLYRIDAAEGTELGPRACAREMFWPLLLATGTTVGALLCSLLSMLPGQRQLGVMSAIGIAGSFLFTVLLLPHIVPRGPAWQWKRKLVLPLSEYCGRFMAWSERHRLALMLALLAAAAAGVVGLTRLRMEGDLSKLNYMNPANRRANQRFMAVWGDYAPTSVVVRGRTMEEALHNNDRLYELLRGEIRERRVASCSSISPILPAVRTQEENWARWRAFWDAPRRAALRAELARAGGALKFSPEAFAPFERSLEAGPPPPVTAADYADTSVGGLVRSCTSSAEGDCCVLSTFTPASPELLPELAARIRAELPGATVLNKRHFADHVAALFGWELQRLGLAACVVVILFHLVVLWRIELVLTVLVPLGLAVVMTLGALGLAGIAINLINAIFVVFVLGVGDDFVVFQLEDGLGRHRTGRRETLATSAAVICALTTLSGFVALVFAKHPALFSVGLTGLLGMSLSLVAAVLAVPAMAGFLLRREGRVGTPSLKTLFGAAWAFVYLGGAAFLYVLLGRHLLRLFGPRDPERRRRLVRRFIHKVTANLVPFFPYLDSKCVYLDAGPEAFARPAVLIANHLAAFDIMVVLALPADMVMGVKRWVWDAPVMGRLVRDAGYLLVEDDGHEAFISQSAECLRRGTSVMVFPEGRRSPDGRMRRFHKGAFELAIRTGAEVVPILLTATQDCTPRGAVWIGDFSCVIRALPRVAPGNFDYRRGSREMADHVRGLLAERQAADWRRSQEGPAFWHNIRSLYNYLGPQVELYVRAKLRLDPVYRGIDAFVPEEGRVLDLGCGYGMISNILGRRSLRREVLGVDFDERRIGPAERSALDSRNVRFERHDILEWDYPVAEAVVLVDVLHYWPWERQQRVIAKACAALCPGGTLVFRATRPPDTWLRRLANRCERLQMRFGYYRGAAEPHLRPREDYLRAFEAGGLRLRAEPAELAAGPNRVFVFGKDGLLRPPAPCSAQPGFATQGEAESETSEASAQEVG